MSCFCRILGISLSVASVAVPAVAQTASPPPDKQSIPQQSTNIQPLLPEFPKPPKEPIELKIQKSEALSLDEAIQIAIQRDPTLLVNKLQVQQAQGAVKQQQAGKLPTLSAGSTYTYTSLLNPNLSNGGVVIAGGPINNSSNVQNQPTTNTLPTQSTTLAGASNNNITSTLSGNIQASWNAYTSGLVEANIENAEQGLKNNSLGVEVQLENLKLNVCTAYFTLQTQEGQVEIAESAVRAAEASLRDTEAQERAGVGTKFDVLSQQVQVANTRQQLLQAQNNRVVAQRDLARVLNFPMPTNVTAQDPIEESGSWDLSLDDSIFQAFGKRSELPQFVAQEKQAKAQENIAYAQIGPQVSLFARLNLFAPQNSGSGEQLSYSVGAQLQWIFYDGGASQGKAEQAIALAKIARVSFINTRQTIRFNVEQQFSTLQTSKEQISTSRQAQGQAEEALRLARLRYRAGVGTQTEVITSENAATQAKVNLLTAVISYNQALAALRRAVGIL